MSYKIDEKPKKAQECLNSTATRCKLNCRLSAPLSISDSLCLNPDYPFIHWVKVGLIFIEEPSSVPRRASSFSNLQTSGIAFIVDLY